MTFPTDGPLWASDDGAPVEPPSAAEIARGFMCGSVRPGLMNYLFQALQAVVAALSAGNFVSQLRNIATTEGIKGGGTLEGDLTLSLAINDLQAETSIANDDLIVIYDASAAAHRSMTRTNFVQGLGGDTGGGLIIGADNIGTGTGEFFAGVDGGSLEFRTLEADDGLNVVIAGDNVVISFADMGSALTFA